MNNTLVQTAVRIPETSPGYSAALPPGFPFLVEEPTRRIVEPVLLYLCDRHLRRNGVWVRNTARAAAEDLHDWWSYLSEYSLAWNEIRREDVELYRDAMLSTVSPHTHQPYAVGTVRRRVGTVLAFYEWARQRGWLDPVLSHDDIRRIPRAIDTDALAHLHPSSGRMKGSRMLPPHRSSPDDTVRPFTARDYRKVACELGPLPSGRAGDPRSSRDRLAAEVCLNTGMRVDEVSHLLVWQILDLRPDRDRPYGVCAMTISKTKGSRPRKVLFPNWLVTEVLAYIEGERAECVEAARARWLKHRADTPGALFVNRMDSGHHVGKPMRSASFQEAFRRAVLDAGLAHTVRCIDPTHGEPYLAKAADHSVHDLRHTFAVWTYHAEREAGNAEPWKKLQALLGHRHLSTTLSTYLRVVDVFEAATSDHFTAFLRQLRDA